MAILTIRSEDRLASTTLMLVEAPAAALPSSDWRLAVEASEPDFLGRNAGVYFRREDAAAFLVQLAALEASRSGSAVLPSMGEGSDAQGFTFSLAAISPTAPLIATADVAKVCAGPAGRTSNRCCLRYHVDQGDLLQILHDAEQLFGTGSNGR